GYKHIRIIPHVGGNLTYANADLKTYYGTVSSHWKIDNGKLQLNVEVPSNAKATVYLPGNSVEGVMENNIALSSSKDIKVTGREGNYVVVEVGSGKYQFTSVVK